MTNFLATIRGIAENPSVTEINIRRGPGTTHEMVCKARVGLSGLPVLEAVADSEGKNFQGKTYQWLRLQFPDGVQGWARDDLLELEGDGRAYGYSVFSVRTYAFLVNRSVQAVAVPAAPAATVPAAPALVPVPVPVPVVAAPAPAPAPPAAPAPAAAPAAAVTTCTAIVMMRDGANARTSASVNASLVQKMARDTRFEVIEVVRPAGDTFQWVRGVINGQMVWMREDVLRYEGDLQKFNLGKNDTYPTPMKNGWWVRGFTGTNPSDHWGWDFGAVTGEPILCGPKGGTVVASVECSKCTGGRSFKNYGLPLSHGPSLGDPAWNFGYGHYVIVRYLNEQLPESTRQWLAQNNLAGAHLFAMYAHLDSRVGQVWQTLAPYALVGTCGDTGNSEATHLHLEVRASVNPNEQWPNMKKHLFDPIILFKR